MSGLVSFPTGIDHRIFEGVHIWDKVEDFEGQGNTAYVLAMVPLAEFQLPAIFEGSLPPKVTSGVTAGTTRGVVVFEKLAPNVTKLTIVQQADFGGHVPTYLANQVAVYALSTIESLRAKHER